MSVERESGSPEGPWLARPILQFAAIVLMVFLAKGAIAEPFYVPSGSMEPTLLIGDALLASKYPLRLRHRLAADPDQPARNQACVRRTPKRGDVVVFRWPGDRSQAWVKRVVGLPGDRIQMRQGQLFINDRAASLKPDGIGEAEDDNGGSDRPIAISRRCRTALRTRFSSFTTMAGSTTRLK
jgi:signal peptidase I